MKIEKYRGVGVIITNLKRNLFYFQQKDEDYWIPSYRLKYCFFGGGLEKNEKEDHALKRELLEELEITAAEVIYKNSTKVFSAEFKDIFGKDCDYSLYESVLQNKTLKNISLLHIKEGKKGILVSREEILGLSFFKDITKILGKYLSLRTHCK
jgi:8-oxo-dGTP pyrophosphatase MutT (NUDIX family)